VVRSSNIPATGGFTSVAFAGGAGGRVFPVNGDTSVNNAYGAGAGGGLAATVPFNPTAPSLAPNCLPNVTVSKRTTTPIVSFPNSNTAVYVITLSNTGPGAAVGTILQDTLQAPFQYNPTTAPLNQIGLAYAAGAGGPASPTTGTGTQTFTVGTPGSAATTFYVPPSGTVTFTVTVVINGGGSTPTFNLPYQNSVTASFLDPFRTVTNSQVSPGGSYDGTTTIAGGSNYSSSSSTQEDVQVFGAVNITITKTNVVNTLTAGQTTSYTVTVANIGGAGGLPLVGGLLRDPAVPGLACTSVTCTVPTGSTSQCPAPAALTVANLQGTGITIPLLNSGTAGPLPSNRLDFQVRCNVTATGL
jgi:uncharacterized repeat protein (TIGR01451 family)